MKTENYTKVEDVPADTLVEMTPELYQEFAIGGCAPACHLTRAWIRTGDKFKLSTVPVAHHPPGATGGLMRLETKEVMLSENADVTEFIKKQEADVANWEKSRADAVKKGYGGCFRVNGKIVH